MVEFLETISRKGLKIPTIHPILNGYTTIKAIDRMSRCASDTMNGPERTVLATRHYFTWFYLQGFMTIPDTYFENPPALASSTSNMSYTFTTFGHRDVQRMFGAIRSKSEWCAYITYEALRLARQMRSTIDQRKLLEWFHKHGYGTPSEGVKLYLAYVVKKHKLEGRQYESAIEKEWDFLSEHVDVGMLMQISKAPVWDGGRVGGELRRVLFGDQ
ncbi:hypothetical protein HDV00_000589 [Rhizophlyctis rosea]|nr:hypothetical protein HDV00_000589 [Rhizophlyctis rosea]